MNKEEKSNFEKKKLMFYEEMRKNMRLIYI